MLCKKCGAQIPDDSVECEFCGAKFADDTENTADDFNSEVKNDDIFGSAEEKNGEQHGYTDEDIFDDNERRRRKQVQKMMEDKKQQLSEIERRRGEKRQRQRRNRIILIAAICAIAIAASGIGVYYVVQNINPTPIVDESPAPTVPAVTATTEPLPTADPSVSPTPGLSMVNGTAAPQSGTETGNNSQSWTSTGNTGSGSSSANRGASSGTNKTSSGSTSTGTSSSSGSAASSSGSTSSSNKGTSAGSSSTVNISNSGKSTNDISVQIATGGEVIYNTGTGRYLMTFVVGNTRYYANVSTGSTTEQIKGKKYTVTANPTKETYNGNTVYNITELTGYSDGDYILPNSGTQLLTANDLKGMSKHDLALARNEIYARHGRKFQTVEYSEYFSGKSWYKLNPNYNYSDDDSNLNEIERKNVSFILTAEKK